jgi:hypothetical protein
MEQNGVNKTIHLSITTILGLQKKKKRLKLCKGRKDNKIDTEQEYKHVIFNS